MDNLKTIASKSQASTTAYIEAHNSRAARLKALDDARKLVLELQDGDDAFSYRLEQAISAQALTFLLSIGVAEKIPTKGSITAEELAKAVGAEKEMIVRMMRLVCCTGTFEETAQDEYAYTKRSVCLIDQGYSYLYEVLLGDIMTIMSRLREYYATHPLETPTSRTHNPFSWSFGAEGTEWPQIFAAHPDIQRKFSIGMSGPWNDVSPTGIYPFSPELAEVSQSPEIQSCERALIVDLGGAWGKTMKVVREAHPELKGKMVVQDLVQDLAPVIAKMPEGFHAPDTNIEVMAHDVREPQPVKGAAAYYFHRVMHNWPDETCVLMLKRVAEVMAPDSRILLAETVVPDRVQSADTYPYWIDYMMALVAAKERTEKEFGDVMGAAGLEVVKV
ncbi:S-adenosyl-L-methionine-dependent methyltransferase [Aulographum hederae CBS 113979]|uniref:S-adenosyl-L-methionine-dependent methyltransferase n=1 Tax=Aulographum hederae CBS 113979 TaxID=1176131 RepID=A0A6G1GS65_9PEZI|nr:S-adenosyl-L-methionine-dependent methyltransferase [Aulographum hederae CBS 113979]